MAAIAATNTSVFHLFTSLAPELRDQIWHAALPDEVGPVLYFYKKGGWGPRRLSLSDERYNHEDVELNVDFVFRHDLLDAVQVEMPLFSVNREARNIALSWIREHNIETRVYPSKYRQLQSLVFVNSFDPLYDALYIAVDKWEEFLFEPDDRCFQPDMLEQFVHIHPAHVTRIAMPEALFQDERAAAYLAELVDRFFNQLKVLFIIVDAPLDLQPVNDGMKMQPRWELQNVEGGAFFWNPDRGRFDFNKSESIIGKALYMRMEEISTCLGEEFVKNSISSFEVRAVFATMT